MDQQGSVECVFDQHRSKQLSVLGSVSHKMMICGRSDSYENTKTAMVEAEIEKGKKKVKEIELGPKGKWKCFNLKYMLLLLLHCYLVFIKVEHEGRKSMHK